MRNRLPEIDFHFSGERFCLFGLSVYMKKYDMTIRTLCARIKGQPDVTEGTAYAILFTISFAHLLNDMIQSVIPAIYPMIKDKFGFSFAQIGVITLVFQLTSSILQPFVGRYADRHPRPYALSLGMCFTLAGLLLLSFAYNFMLILLAVSIIGWGSSVFHPEASRVAQLASGGKKSLAQSIFQVGGNGGSAIGPLLAALIIIPFGQPAISCFAMAAVLASLILARVGRWYGMKLATVTRQRHAVSVAARQAVEKPGPDVAFDSCRADILEILLYLLHDELFHVLLDGQVRYVRTAFPSLFVRLSGGIGCRDFVRWSVGRPFRA